MKLIKFRVMNFRSINDSGLITVSKVTTLVGRNESGKTNLLRALQSLNPPGGIKELSPIKDFPRGRRLTECKPETPVLETRWEFDAAERAELTKKFPRAKDVTEFVIWRFYKAVLSTGSFSNLPAVSFDHAGIVANFQSLKAAIMPVAEKLDAAPKTQLEAAVTKAEPIVTRNQDALAWANAAKAVLAELQKTITATGADVGLSDADNAIGVGLERTADSIIADDKARAEALTWASKRLPVFVFLDEYPELDGHQNIDEYLQRKANNQINDADRNFEKLCKVAGLDPQQLKDLLAKNDHETRNQLANRAGAVVTGEIRRLWKDRALKVRFNPDAAHLDTLVSDPNALYDIEVNLDERSRGFKWFFSFYITFAADTQGGSAENAVLLLDEPGLYLHAASQSDLLKHLATDFKNQVVYTTHSPFMVPTANLDWVRTVNIGQDEGTTVTNDPTGDARTLFPIQAALGYHLAQSLFVGPNNLVVEGVTDYWILSSVAEYLRSIGHGTLPPDVAITPAGGAQKVTYMVALLTSEELNVIVLLDDENIARQTKEELVKQKLIREDCVLFVSDAFDAAQKPAEADIEDLIDEAVYAALVDETYKNELAGKVLNLNQHIPRIVKRYEDAFRALGMEFHKTRPARLLLQRMGKDPATIITDAAKDRFVRLFEKISAQMGRQVARARAPFI